jgi:hypothetical protein
MNQLQAVALNEGLRCKKRLWRAGRQQLESFPLVSSVLEPMPARSARVAGSTDSNNCRVDAGHRAAGQDFSISPANAMKQLIYIGWQSRHSAKQWPSSISRSVPASRLRSKVSIVILPCQWRGSPGLAFFPLCP